MADPGAARVDVTWWPDLGEFEMHTHPEITGDSPPESLNVGNGVAALVVGVLTDVTGIEGSEVVDLHNLGRDGCQERC